MINDEQFNIEAGKLSPASRIVRIALGATLLGFTMSYNGVLGAFAVLPLLAVYPVLTGVLGYGLVEAAAVREHRGVRPIGVRRTVRAINALLGAGLIAAVMSGVTSQVWVALLGIYPILTAALGSNLLGEAFRTRYALQREGRVYPLSSLSKKARHAVTIESHAQKAA